MFLGILENLILFTFRNLNYLKIFISSDCVQMFKSNQFQNRSCFYFLWILLNGLLFFKLILFSTKYHYKRTVKIFYYRYVQFEIFETIKFELLLWEICIEMIFLFK